MNHRISPQLYKYLFGGFIAVIGDWGISVYSSQYLEFEDGISKAAGFITGSTFAFFYHGIFTFGFRPSIVRFVRHAILYTSSLLINVIVFKFVLKSNLTLLGSGLFFALTIATTFSMAINFFGMRMWVFRLNEGYA